jgi:hypothetical protein
MELPNKPGDSELMVTLKLTWIGADRAMELIPKTPIAGRVDR